MGSACCRDRSQPNSHGLQLSEKQQVSICPSVPSKTKKSLAFAHLLATIITDYFENGENRCPFMTDEANSALIAEICDNIYLQGGACRDILLNEPVNDLDLMANTRELCKIQSTHLRKYHHDAEHQSDSRCALWRLYLRKLEEETKVYDAQFMEDSSESTVKPEIMCSYGYIRKCPYVLNAQYIAAIWAQSVRFEDTLKAESFSWTDFDLFSLQIEGEVRYNSFDLNGEEIEMVDVFPRDYSQYRKMMALQRSQENGGDADTESPLTKDDSLHFFCQRVSSREWSAPSNMSTGSPTALESVAEHKVIGTGTRIKIEVPIYDRKIQQQMQGNDLSINCCILSLFAITETIGNVEDDSFEITDTVYNDIKSKVNGCTLYDFERDLKEKLLSSSLKSIVGQGPHVHFWRVIKFAVRYYDKGWTVNPELVSDHKRLYGKWIDDDTFLGESENQKELITQNLTYGLATTVDGYEKMLKTFIVMGFDEKLKSALQRNESFRKRWMAALKENDTDIINVFTDNGYCTE